MTRDNRLTTDDYWDGVHSTPIRMRLPSELLIHTRNFHRLLRQRVRPGSHVLEIGFAPGKHLAFAAKALGARVSGIDYSRSGIALATELFSALGIEGDLRCEDVFANSFAPGSFDLVYSAGVIEHFDDPREIVRCHVDLLRPGGTALILIPDYGGIYGRAQRYFDSEILGIHNLKIMSPEAMRALAPTDLAQRVQTFRTGRLNSWQITIEKRWSPIVSRAVHLFCNGLALLQPFDIGRLCPTIALEIVRSDPSGSIQTARFGESCNG